MTRQATYVNGFAIKYSYSSGSYLSSLRNLHFLFYFKIKTPNLQHHLEKDHIAPFTIFILTTTQTWIKDCNLQDFQVHGKRFIKPTNSNLREQEVLKKTDKLRRTKQPLILSTCWGGESTKTAERRGNKRGSEKVQEGQPASLTLGSSIYIQEGEVVICSQPPGEYKI